MDPSFVYADKEFRETVKRQWAEMRYFYNKNSDLATDNDYDDDDKASDDDVKTFVNLVKQRMSTTTAHGIPQITSAKTTRRKFSWVLLFCFAVGMFFWQTQELLIQYFNYDFDTTVEIKFSPRLDFPAITICNINPVKNDRLQESNVTDLRQKFDPTYVSHDINTTSALRQERNADDEPQYEGSDESTKQQPTNWNDWNKLLENKTAFYSLPTTIASEQATLVRILSDMTNGEREYLGHQLNDLLVNCSWIGYPCSPQNFSRFLDPLHGNCYTFNPLNASYAGGEYKTTSFAGPTYGLTMTIFIEQNRYLPMISSSGIRLHVHSQKNMPFPEDEGLQIPPGYHTSVSITKSVTKRIGSPYNTCVKDSDESFHNIYSDLYGVSYSVQTCTKSCYQEKVVERCGCFDSNYPFRGGIGPCRYGIKNDSACLSKVSADYKNSLFHCDCPQPCNVDEFKVSTSFSYWPTPNYKNDLLGLLNVSSPNLHDIVMKDEKDMRTLRENLLLLDIYYANLNYDFIQESAVYSRSDLASGLGGTVGLWIGVSVLTVFEAIEFIYDAAYLLVTKVCIRKKSKSKLPKRGAESTVNNTSEIVASKIDRRFIPVVKPYGEAIFN
ncbi:amiloride-sensitive sodium channel subunit alpha-like [Anneissia japonica]|uniref:amiloride-sensitive sodium channel subunit alpha-like n=1 Tax=Anneissia japonica TaxID=1529436 RepID=UPI0014255A62|nr:amiloride-sensitive sodium channel subunit alpha-like [Anneissia japonica]